MSRSKKIILAVVIVVLVAALGFAGWWFFLRGGGSASGGVYVQAVSDVNMADNGLTNRYSGIIETQKTEKVQLDSSKKVKEVLVQEGDRVDVGDPLFTYDTESTSLDIQQAQLELERLNTNITNSNNQITQLEKAMKTASSSDKLSYSAQIQELQAEVAQAQYDLKSKQAEIEKLQASVDNATVAATMAGTIDSIADPNDTSAQPSYNGDDSGSAFITILADGDFRVKGTLDEQTMGEIYVGAPVIVRSRVDDSVSWTGTISTIETQPAQENNNNYSDSGESASKYPFYVDLDSIDGLMLGQHVTIEMDYGQAEKREGIWLDASFIVSEEDGSSYVWAAKSGGARLEKRAVTLGAFDEDLYIYEIVSGLEPSEYIAWPDEDCVAGAPTTTEMVFDEDDMYIDDGAYAEGDTGLPEGVAFDDEGNVTYFGEPAEIGDDGFVYVNGEPVVNLYGDESGDGDMLYSEEPEDSEEAAG